ncbi:hypothetical protein Ahy_A06g029378 [Arachis hypogaea]|uniref:DUF223 domain-containing protein n=1 Tax=Arachis hypogaea TaxID=3818 RepID=A0A445CT60_ARAHY|nr:hypothetical protein Ahy_A06g029378 [Arachis hypogaea]
MNSNNTINSPIANKQLFHCSKNTISCSLFGEVVDRIFSFLDRESSEPLIFVFQLFRPFIYKEVTNFKKKLLAFGSSESQRINHISSQLYQSPIEELSKGLVYYGSLVQLLYWMLARMIEKAKPIGDHFSCDFCMKEGVPVSLRIKVYVTDNGGSLWVDDNSNNYPNNLDVILDKKILFKINIKTNNIAGNDVVYNVTRIYDDHDIIKKFTYELDEDSGSESVNEIITIGSLRLSQKRFSSEVVQQVTIDLDKDRLPTSISYKGVKDEGQENYGLEIEYVTIFFPFPSSLESPSFLVINTDKQPFPSSLDPFHFSSSPASPPFSADIDTYKLLQSDEVHWNVKGEVVGVESERMEGCGRGGRNEGVRRRGGSRGGDREEEEEE